MEAMRQRWTDERMDDLNARVDDLARRMENGFNRVDTRLASLHDAIGALRADIDARFDALHKMLLQFCGTTIVALVGLIVTQIAS